MTIVLQDPDVTLHHGNVHTVLPTLEAGSVDCVITSPPYWGLRDYGTGTWEGGDEGCDHKQRVNHGHEGSVGERNSEGNAFRNSSRYVNQGEMAANVCGKCGARRVDNQLGLEATPDEYVTRMVDVFREVRRVLADHGTCWINLGDSYAGGGGYAPDAPINQARAKGEGWGKFHPASTAALSAKKGTGKVPGLKPKDLVGVPWRVAFALQADGWYLRSDIIWAKPNPMPESVTDRPTKAHEYVFLLTKQPRYFFDQEAVREKALRAGDIPGGDDERGVGEYGVAPHAAFNGPVPSRRNIRTVWEIATQPYPEAHFATYPEELVRRCLLAGCPEWVCGTCGKPRERIVERGDLVGKDRGGNYKGREAEAEAALANCGHNDYRPGRVLDPFLGSGTTAHVARKHARHTIGIELNEDYCQLAARRLQQLSLLT